MPGDVEDRLYESWEKRGLIHADADAASPDAPPFCIVIPPPNVTGSLHIGHALDHTLIDALVRRRRMQGYNDALAARAWTTPASPPRTWSSGSWPRRA